MVYIGCLIKKYIPLVERSIPLFFGGRLSRAQNNIKANSKKIIKKIAKNHPLPRWYVCKTKTFSTLSNRNIRVAVARAPTNPTPHSLLWCLGLSQLLKSNNLRPFPKDCRSNSYHGCSLLNCQLKVSAHSH